MGGHLPIMRYVVPLKPTNGSSTNHYWEIIAAGVPDMNGSREQAVWFRYTHLQCAGTSMAPPCAIVGRPLVFDTYWWSSGPGQTMHAGPVVAAASSGFYTNLMEVRTWWSAELGREGMMEVSWHASCRSLLCVPPRVWVVETVGRVLVH
eukprot:COSAG01_NODE_3382_length_6164_cov_204.291838_7_plen_149_part_00